MGVLSVARGRDAVGCVVGARGIKSHPVSAQLKTALICAVCLSGQQRFCG